MGLQTSSSSVTLNYVAETLHITIQSRDIALLRLLVHIRVVTLAHLAFLIFDGSKEAAKKRVQKLKTAGLVLERRRKAYEPSILFLSKRGLGCLWEHQSLPEQCADISSYFKRMKISELTLRHELQVLDVKVAFHAKLPKDCSLVEFSTWPRLYEFSVCGVGAKDSSSKTVKPDGFVRIHEREGNASVWEHLFFVEVDRSTERLEIVIQKVLYYNQFYRDGGMAIRHGKTAEDFKKFPFRVLIVCKSKERRDNIAKMLLTMENPILTQVMLTTLAESCTDPLGRIWRMPKDYLDEGGSMPSKRELLEAGE